MDESPTERRIDELGRNIFDRAVTQAAELVAQRIAAIHRVRLVTQAFLAALVVSASLALILAVVIANEVQSQDKRAAVANCQLIQALEKPLSDFVRSDARSTMIGRQTTNYWLRSVAPRLDAIATVECSRR